MRRPLALLTLLLVLVGCAAPYDDDGEVLVAGSLAPASAKESDAVPVVVDSDLAPDDLAAISYLVRHPGVEVVGITVPATGLVACPAGLGLLDDLFAALDAEPVPVSCGTAPSGPEGVGFPGTWMVKSLTDSGLHRRGGKVSLEADRRPPVRFLAGLARRHEGLHLVALGPLTEVAGLLRAEPAAYSRLAGVTTMAGVVSAASHDPKLGVGEWNAGADPEAFAAVLAGPVPVTVVPDDPVPLGRPAGMAVPVVGNLGMAPGFVSPAFWDLATAAVFTLPEAAEVEPGTWVADVADDRGRLTRTGDGDTRVVTSLDTDLLDEAYREVFAG